MNFMNRVLLFLMLATYAHAANIILDPQTKLTSPTDIKLRADTVNSSGTITTSKGIIQTATLLTGSVIDWSLSGIRYANDLSGDVNYTFSNVTSDKSICVYIPANGHAVTFPLASTNWDGGTLPTASASGEDTYIFTYINGHYHGSFLPAVSSGGSQVWTNNTDFIWPSGMPAPDITGSTAGPNYFFNTNGSLFIGPNVTQDSGDPTSYHAYPYFVSLVDSNDPASIFGYYVIADNESYNYKSVMRYQLHADQDDPQSLFSFETQLTNGVGAQIKFQNEPSNLSGSTYIRITTQADGTVFSADGTGQVIANGFTDSSGTEGQYVAYGAAGRLIATNLSTIITNNSPSLMQAMGFRSGEGSPNAAASIFIGDRSGLNADNATYSAFLGFRSGQDSSDIERSIFVGAFSGNTMPLASKSIFLGYGAGINRANTLWIDTQSTTDDGTYQPLIYGEFDNRFLQFNGSLVVTGDVSAATINSSTIPVIWTGTTNIGNLATSLVIAIGHTMPDTNYVPSISFIGSALAGAVSPSYSATTTTQFTVNLSVGIAGGENLRWSVISNP